MPNQSAQINRVFQALADPTRRAVIERLCSGPAAMSELAQPFDMALPSFSQHLAVLESCGLVRSTKTGRVRTYQNPAGKLASAADTGAFASASTAASVAVEQVSEPLALPPELKTAEATTCAPGPTDLCLNGRFRVSLSWKTQGSQGAGQAVPLTADTGHFWFFQPSNVEVVNVIATVRDKSGKLITNLEKDDFVLKEDGKKQTIQYFARQTDLPLTIGLLVDTSLSQTRVLEQQRTASYRFLDRVLKEKDQAFVIRFDREVELVQDLTDCERKPRRFGDIAADRHEG